MKINNSLIKNYLALFSRYHSDYYYFKHGMEYFMWNFYISSVKKGEGLLHAYISSLINTKAGFFHRDVMPKAVFSIFKKDPLLICDLVMFIHYYCCTFDYFVIAQ